MKRLSILAVLAIPAVLASCEKNSVEPSVLPGETITISASLDDVTRTQISGTSALWTAGDQISLYSGAADAGAVFTTDIDTPATTASFTGTGSSSVDGILCAFYPASQVSAWYGATADGSSTYSATAVKFYVPAVQEAVADNIPQNANLMYGTGDATTEHPSLSFHHLVSYISFTIGDASPANIVSVEMEHAGGSTIAGKYKAECTTGTTTLLSEKSSAITLKKSDNSVFEKGTYYIAFRAATNNQLTFKFTLSDGSFAKITTPDSKSFQKGDICHIGTIRNLTFTPGYLVGDIYQEGSVNKGIIVDADNENGDYVIMSLQGINGTAWASVTTSYPAASSDTDGKANTDAIVAAAQTSGEYDKLTAIKFCRDMGEDWYLPARNELKSYLDNFSIKTQKGFDDLNGKIEAAEGLKIYGDTPSVFRFLTSTEYAKQTDSIYYLYINSSNVWTTASCVKTKSNTARIVRCLRKLHVE